MMRLWLVGDDEVLDVLADLSRHLDYFEVSRVDDAPAKLDAKDHVVIALTNESQALALLARVLASGAPGFAGIVPNEPGDSVGARAILVAAELVSALHDRR